MGKRKRRGGRPHGDLFSPPRSPASHEQEMLSRPAKRQLVALDRDYRSEKSDHWVLSLTSQVSAAHDRKSFLLYTRHKSFVTIGQQSYPVLGYGQVELHIHRDPETTRVVYLRSVLHIPSLPYNVLSVPIVMGGQGLSVYFQGESGSIQGYFKTFGKISAIFELHGDLYVLAQTKNLPHLVCMKAFWTSFHWPKDEFGR